MSKNIVDGVLVETSPSMITAFDASTSFGCEQRGVFKYVMGYPDPPSGNQELGTDLHALAEERLLTGKTPSGEGEAFGLYLAGQAMIEQVAARKILKVEQPIPTFYISGVKVKGYNDVVTIDGIVDWKTSSDIRRYGKTAADLAKDTAMIIYGKAEHANLPVVKLAHGQFQTKGRKSTDFVEVEVTQEHLDAHIEKVIVPLIERIKELAAHPDRAVRDFKKCFNCTFRPRCPTPGAETVMGFFSKVINKPAEVVANGVANTTDTRAEIKAIENSMRITPPDAPASKPEIAADPVAGFEALPAPRRSLLAEEKPTTKDVVVEAMNKSTAAFAGESQTDRDAREALEYSQKLAEEAKLAKEANDGLPDVASMNGSNLPDEKPAPAKRGRPPGAKNKPKNEPLSNVPVERMEEVIEKFEKGEVSIEQARKLMEPETKRDTDFTFVSVTKGCSINVGNYNNVKFEVTLASETLSYDEVLAEVMRRLDAEAAKYEAEVSPSKVKGEIGPVVNAKGLVSK